MVWQVKYSTVLLITKILAAEWNQVTVWWNCDHFFSYNWSSGERV